MPSGTTRLPILTVLIGVTSLIAARLPTIQSEARADAQPAARLCGNEHRAVVFSASADATTPHVLTLTVTGGTFGLDGIVVR